MPIIVKSGDFKPSDPFGLYKDRANPFAPPPAPVVDPEAARIAAEIEAADQANAATEASWQSLEAKEPGRYAVIDESEYEQWQADWQARQPGWLEDTARILGGSVAKGAGAVVGGLGNAITALGNATTTKAINHVFGTDYGQANPLSAPQEWLTTLGEKTQEGVSFATREAIANSTPDGDLLDPSTWTLGKQPSLVGYTALALDVFGQMTPVIAAAVFTGPAGGAIVGGLQGGGAASQQASALIDQMAAEPGVLERESAFYREQIAAGRTHEEALAATKAAAEQTAFLLTAPISGLGGYATGKIIDPATAVLAGRNIIARITGRAALSGLEEGAQEAAETAATRAGTNIGAGTDLSLTDGTFADFVLGALGGSVPGAAAGALSTREEPETPAQPLASPTAAPAPAPQTPTIPPSGTAPSGPLSRALDHGIANAPAPMGQTFIVNDPPLPGMGAGAAHGEAVTLAPDQNGIDPSMARVVLPDGSERIMGKRLLQTETGQALADDPQGAGRAIAAVPSAPGLPQPGSRAIVNLPDMPQFNATIEQFVDLGDGAIEAIIADDDGEVLQVPVSALSSLNLSPREVEALERADNPPPPATPPAPETRPLLRDLKNEMGQPTTLKFPDEALARLYDYGAERAMTNRLSRKMGSSALEVQATPYRPDVRQALAEEFGVLPERIEEIADDYRYRAERAARRGTEQVVSNMHGLDQKVLARWQAERAAAPEAEEEPGSTPAPESPSDADAQWWDGLQPGARKTLLVAAKVKRSEKSTWDKFTKQIKAKLAPLRAEMEGLDKARARSQALDAAPPPSDLSDADATLRSLTAAEEAEIYRRAQAEADQSNFPDEADDYAERTLEAARQQRIRDIEDAREEERYRAQVDKEASEAATSPENDRPEPSAAQKDAGNYKMGHARLGGLDLSIENPAGSERKGTDRGGKAWSVTMKSHYGYIKGTVGKDKDHIDVFVKPGTEALDDGAMVTVVNQVNEAGQFDEHKVMLGFNSQSEAEAAYRENYTKGWKGLGSVGLTTMAGLKAWLKDGDTRKPFGPAKATAESSPEQTRRELTSTGRDAKPFAREELFRDVADMLRRNRALEPIAALVAVDAKGSEILDAFEKHVGQHMAGSSGNRTSFQARAKKLEVLMPSPDGKEPVRKTFQGGDLVALLRSAVGASETPKAKSDGNALPNATAPEHVQQGVDDREMAQIVSEFKEAQASMMEGEQPVTNIFMPPKKGEIVRLADKAKRHVAEKGWMTPAEAKTQLEQWKDHARAQGENQAIRSANSNKVVLSLFDLSGEWSRPWEEAGYQVYRFDIQDNAETGDVNNFSTDFFGDWFGDFDGMDIYAILAACPCTDFAVSGARHFAAKDADGRTVASVKLVHQTLRTIEYFKPSLWALENPVGRIEQLTGLPPWRLSFDPNHIGDPYTKKTLIWGRFNADLPIAPVEPTEGSKMWRQYGGKSQATKNARSVTPEGFSYGFFMANNAHDHAAMAIGNKFDRLDQKLIGRAIDAGVTPEAIQSAVEDFYYIDLDDAAANAAVKALLPSAAPTADAKVSKPVKATLAPGVTLETKIMSVNEVESTFPNAEVTDGPDDPAARPMDLAGKAPFAKNKLFTADKVEAARARLKSKMGQLNSGIDPEVLVDGMTIAGAYIEAGVRDFSDYAAQMTADFGDRIKPYLLSFWEGARNYPGLETKGMTPTDEATRLHKALVTDLPREEAAALGQELAPPKKRAKKTGSAGDRTLIQDFGVDNIDGWSFDGEGQETDFGVTGGVKDNFLRDAVAYLNAVAGVLKEQGYAPSDDARGRPSKAVSKNESGPATSGDAYLTVWNPDTGVRVYAHITGSALRGMVPSTKSGVSIMFRVGLDTDRYATRATNQWAPVDLSAADLAGLMLRQAERLAARGGKPLSAEDKQRVINELKAEIARPALEPVENGNDSGSVQSGLEGQTGNRVGADAGGAALRPQRDTASADSERLAERQPGDVETVAAGGSGRPLGARRATADVGGEGQADLFGDVGDRRPRAGRAQPSDARAGERSGRDGTDLVTVKPPESVSPANKGPGNFHIDDPLAIVGGGQVARFEKNKAAIELANALRDEGRQATREEQVILAGYTGWGSFGQDLFQGTWGTPRPKAGWEARDAWLRSNLGQAEWEGLQRSITNAHYTDPPTVMAMWDMVARMGFAGGRVLEPAMGIGNFFGMMPLPLKGRSQLTGIELDPTTGGMAKLLYPDANIAVMGYQDSKTPDDFYDLVIGNWPFEDTVIADRRYNRLSPFLHDYFYLKAVDQVRPGGLVMGITSKGTLDKKDSGIRSELAKKAELVAAFRLPSGAFQDYAGTNVVTDIIVLRKRPEALGNSAGAGWIKSVPYMTPQGEEVSVNEYYLANPDHVVGQIEFGSGTTFRRPGLIVTRPDDMMAQMKRITALVPEGAYRADRRAQKQISYITNHTDDREGALVKSDKGLFIVRGEHLAPAADIAKYEVKDAKVTASRVAQLEALINMRKAYAALIAEERNPEGNPEPARRTLKAQYDTFVKAHGTLSGSYGLAYLSKIDDPFYPALAALEVRDGKGIRPATILSQSTVRAARKIDKPSVTDAFVLARNSAINPGLEQIAEIAKRPAAEVRAELIEKGAVFELPGGDIVPADIYLSGNVREKMRQALAARDAGTSGMERNIEALAKVMPPDVPYYAIEVQMGASWVPTRTYADYVAHMLNGDSAGVQVHYTAGRWRISIDNVLKGRPEASAGFGTPVYSFQKLVNAAISNQTVTIRKEDHEGNVFVDEEATAEVNEKIANIRSSFGEWLWSDLDRRVALEAEYNEVRNAYASPRFDGSFLSFEGMALSLGKGPFDLREHQANAIWRGLVMRRSLNAHEVGSGKTFTMGGIAVESRRYGLAKKPLIFAHNANSASVAAEIQQMYPASKVLYIDNLAPAQIDVKMRQIANDDWDAVVVPHSLISRFALTEETLMALAAEEIAAIEAEAYAAAEDDGVKLTEAMLDDEEQIKKLRSPTAKDLVKMRNRIIETIKKQGQRASKEGAVSFEELGVDMVLVDEVHEFKKPPFSTRMRIKGLNTQSSDRSIALSFLLRYIRGQNNGGNVHLFTGTPVTNTLTEVFHAMRYIMAEEMGEVGVDQWDGWFGSFAREVQDVELNAAAEYEAVNRLAGFINVPELRRMIGQYMDVVFAEDMPEMRPRRTKSGKLLSDPTLTEAERAELLNGRTEDAQDRPYKKVIVETADLTPAQQEAFAKIQGYAQRWRKMTGKEKRDVMQLGGPESPIVTEGLAAKASFDVRLMDGEALAGREGQADDEPNSKASRVVRNVLDIYRSHKQATQVIFTNAGLSTTGTRSVGEVGAKSQERFKVFSTVGDIVERLVQGGIPRDQIAVVDGSTSKEKRKEVADAMNRAEIRVVIGSTQSLGVGVNMQRNLRAMHHMDAPWMPGDLEQRNGRGMRQGNQWNTVLEYRYLTDRIDGRRWQVLAIKQRFINAFLKADDTTRVIEGDAASDEESDILTTFAEAAGDPRVLIREKLRKKIDQLNKKRRLHDTGIVDARRSAEKLDQRIAELRSDQARLGPIVEKVSTLSKTMMGDGFAVTINGKSFDKRAEAKEALETLIDNGEGFGPGMEPRRVGSFGGHPLEVRWARLSDLPRLTLVVDGEAIAGNMGTLTSLESRLRNYGAEIADLAPQIADAERSSLRLRAQAKEPFHQAKDLERAEKELAALEADLSVNPVPPPAWLRSGAPIDTEVNWDGNTYVVSGHRWNSQGWFVLTSGDDGVIEMPYDEVRDAQGMALYEKREFTPPELIEKAAPSSDAKKSVRSDRRDGSVALVRQQLRRRLGDIVDVLEQSGRLTIVQTADAEPGVQGWTEPDGSITLVADAIGDDPTAVLLHEAFHSGAHDLLGSSQWRMLMIRLAGLYRQFEQSRGKAREFFDAARSRVQEAEAVAGTLGEGIRVEEFAAYAIEEQASAPAALSKWVDDLLGAIKAWALRRFGRQLGAVTPSQLKAIARAALSAASPDGGPRPAMASRRRSLAARTGNATVRINKQSIIDGLAGKLTDLKPAALAAVPLNYFTELKRPGMFAVDQYLKLKRQMDAYRGEKHAKVDDIAQQWQRYAGLGFGGANATGRTRAAALADLMHESTLAGIDPSSTDEETSAKPGYEALRARYLALPRSGQELYRKVRDAYRDQADELDQILLDNVKKTQELAFRRAEDKYRERLEEIGRSKLTGLDKSKAEAEAQKTYAQEMGRATYNMKARLTKMRLAFEASRVPAPYFPLARFGQYFVTVRDLEGNVLSFSRRETDAERRRLERDMREAYPNHTVESGLLAERSSARDMMDPRIVAEIETLLGDANVDERVMDMIWQRYLETMPDLSARKRFIHRKGVKGFDGDALRTFANNQFHAAHQMARLKYGMELGELTNQAVDQAKKADDPVRAMQLANELKKRHEWVMNPTGSRAVQAVTSTMFVWYLAASPAAALVNLSQTPMVALPVLGARLGGIGKASAALVRASGDIIRGRGSARNAALAEDERRAMEAFYESGLIDRTQAHDLAGVGEVGVAYSPIRHKVMAVISWAYHNVEVWNRESTALAAYRLAREQGHHEGKAIDLAHELTWKSHFDYSNASRPRAMQGDFQKLALVFMSHQVNMWYRLFRDVHQTFKGESPQARKEARYQLAGLMAMTSLFAGVSGLFGYNVLMAILGLAFDDDDDPRAFHEEFEGHIIDLLGKDLGGIVIKGAPGHLTGVDLTSRLGMPDFFIRAPDTGSEGRDWFRDLIVGALGVVPSTLINGVDGAGLIMQGDWARGIEVLAPKGVKDLMQAYRYANEGVLSRKGDTYLAPEQITPLDWLVEGLGFTPAKVAETYERMGALKDAEQRVLDERRELMNRFALAVSTGDPEARRAAIEAIKVWNRKPYARMVPITGDSLTQSLKARARNADKRHDGVLITDPELSHYLRELMPEHLY